MRKRSAAWLLAGGGLLSPLGACGTPSPTATGAAAPGPSSGLFVYAVEITPANTPGRLLVHGVDPVTGAFTPVASLPLPGRPEGIAASPDARFLYVTDGVDGDRGVLAFRIDPALGTLTPLGHFGQADARYAAPAELAAVPGALFVRTRAGTTGMHGSIEGFRVDSATGALTPLGQVSDISDPTFLAAHASGRLYSAGEDVDLPGGVPFVLDSYDVVDGRLGNATRLGVESGTLSGGIEPSGRVLVLTLRADARTTSAMLALFRLDARTGRPEPSMSLTLPGLQHAAIHPGGRFLCTAALGSPEIVAFSLDATGGTVAELFRVPTGSRSQRLLFDLDGRFLYVRDTQSGTVAVFEVDGGTGALRDRGRAATGLGPFVLVRPRP
jgi:6-phosphogluconolactonase